LYTIITYTIQHFTYLILLKLIMDFIGFDQNSVFTTEFTPNKIIQLIDEKLTDLCEKNNYKITEEINYHFVTNCNITKVWSIEFYSFRDIVLQYNTWDNYLKLKISVTFKQGQGKDGKSNLLEFKDCSDVKSIFCEDTIFVLKYFITKKEKAHRLRYLEREPFLLLIKGSVTNYDDFSAEDLEKINAEKTTSKKRRVLENHWLQREISEYIDYIQHEIDISLVMGCFRRRYK